MSQEISQVQNQQDQEKMILESLKEIIWRRGEMRMYFNATERIAVILVPAVYDDVDVFKGENGFFVSRKGVTIDFDTDQHRVTIMIKGERNYHLWGRAMLISLGGYHVVFIAYDRVEMQ